MDNFNISRAEMVTQITPDCGTSFAYRRNNKDKDESVFGDSCYQLVSELSFISNSGDIRYNETSNASVSDSGSQKNVDASLKELEILLKYEDVPTYLQHNPYIRSGYRSLLPMTVCVRSIFWWTNETINIWSHLIGWILFFGLTVNDIHFLNIHAAVADKVIVGGLLICFQLCMFLSSTYHIFCCGSENHYKAFLAYDLFGIALSLLAIFISGIYYAFWCQDALRNFYITSIVAFFFAAMAMQIPKLNVNENFKVCMFTAWAVYGLIPTIHWAVVMGGFQNAMVTLLLPRIIIMYSISALAFLIYLSKVPERWIAGKVDFVGHSHNWWHFLILGALYFWHNTGMTFALFMIENGCVTDRNKCYFLQS